MPLLTVRNLSVSFETRDGSVRAVNDVTFSLEATVTGWKALLMGRAVQATMNSEVGTLETLKRILES